tara:strand:- start:204 stop:539 length:336 start_codon:yes stop_codon:yes gene_type:complete
VVSRFLFPYNVFSLSVFKFNSFFSISFERWQKTALLVFQRWLLCWQKPNVLFVRLAFFSMKHNMYIYDIPIAAIPHMCEGLINLFKCIKIQNPPITENRKGFLFNRGEYQI